MRMDSGCGEGSKRVGHVVSLAVRDPDHSRHL